MNEYILFIRSFASMYELSDFGDTKPLRTASKMLDKDPWKIEREEEFTNVADMYDDPSRVVDERGMQLGEAANLHSDIETAKDYGYVTRG